MLVCVVLLITAAGAADTTMTLQQAHEVWKQLETIPLFSLPFMRVAIRHDEFVFLQYNQVGQRHMSVKDTKTHSMAEFERSGERWALSSSDLQFYRLNALLSSMKSLVKQITDYQDESSALKLNEVLEPADCIPGSTGPCWLGSS
jgi:hypothetical protein